MSSNPRPTSRLQNASAVITALAAVLALIVIPWQLREAERLQQAQSARDMYRDFLNLTVQKPEVAATDWCAVTEVRQRIAYEAYVDHLLYTAEQVLSVSADWRGPMQAQLQRHSAYLCNWTEADLADFSDGLVSLLGTVRQACPAVRACP